MDVNDPIRDLFLVSEMSHLAPEAADWGRDPGLLQDLEHSAVLDEAMKLIWSPKCLVPIDTLPND